MKTETRFVFFKVHIGATGASVHTIFGGAKVQNYFIGTNIQTNKLM